MRALRRARSLTVCTFRSLRTVIDLRMSPAEGRPAFRREIGASKSQPLLPIADAPCIAPLRRIHLFALRERFLFRLVLLLHLFLPPREDGMRFHRCFFTFVALIAFASSVITFRIAAADDSASKQKRHSVATIALSVFSVWSPSCNYQSKQP